MNIRGTDFIMFPVSNLARAAAFYRDILDLPQKVYSEEYQWAEYDCGNITLSLKGGSHPNEIAAGARLALAVENIQAAFEELKAKDVPPAGPPQDHGVCQHLEIRDPDGHIVILHHRADGTFG
jgi:catechol 2,3-dioxygenase-like lactoylglutathione lyase family enzyme